MRRLIASLSENGKESMAREIVKQAILSAYPTARLEEVAEHNIFSQVGRIPGTLGGELTLKESFAYPIATYQDIKRDGMQALLNAMSTLGKEDGAAIDEPDCQHNQRI